MYILTFLSLTFVVLFSGQQSSYSGRSGLHHGDSGGSGTSGRALFGSGGAQEDDPDSVSEAGSGGNGLFVAGRPTPGASAGTARPVTPRPRPAFVGGRDEGKLASRL